MPDPLGLLRTAYGDLSGTLSSLTVEEGWVPTGCAGWTPVDLGFHLLSDARRALVALNTPSPARADTTAVDYWTAWRPPAPGDDEELWSTRIAASVHGGLPGIAARYAETSAAVLVAAERVRADDLVRTQGRVLTVADLLSTLTVEAAVHHLDLVAHLDRPGPAAEPLGEVRLVLEGLLGRRLPAGWGDVTAARRGTGREPLTDADRAGLGKDAGAFPLFG
ncbi:maleylpyruvate isomerase N-terminal domain-containing protein [Blastococcus tunisiensis]|uniref:Mycothiol maleylpyruvate isomerase N-terminal domain-containing protein n=1 Tax=Blastococcus tunisiensis TaxID=1798228 RepID=A0A1I1YKI8_9ACTN|nr:maleylpyruvate isomerase N-terminal domain-containing protein [Blastococcus sp. DSM 46838]SFE19909.1 Mycothiol maleylpyruvate isomerase N-terminal domain-containing protein [Blastococcus sp. DSM 46838]